MGEFDEIKKRLSTGEMETLQLLYSLEEELDKPTFRVQSDPWKSEWYKLKANIQKTIFLINGNQELPLELGKSVLVERAAKLLAQTQINPKNLPDPDNL